LEEALEEEGEGEEAMMVGDGWLHASFAFTPPLPPV